MATFTELTKTHSTVITSTAMHICARPWAVTSFHIRKVPGAHSTAYTDSGAALIPIRQVPCKGSLGLVRAQWGTLLIPNSFLQESWRQNKKRTSSDRKGGLWDREAIRPQRHRRWQRRGAHSPSTHQRQQGCSLTRKKRRQASLWRTRTH